MPSPNFAADSFQISNWVVSLRPLPISGILLMLGAGLIFLLYGRAIFRLALIVNAAIVAGYFGLQLGQRYGYPAPFAAGFGVVSAILAWPLFKLTLAFCAGLIGAALAVLIITAVSDQSNNWPIAAGVGFILFAILGWYLRDPAIIVFTAIQGGAVVVLCTLTLLEQIPFLSSNIRWLVYRQGTWVWLAVLAVSLMGASFQLGFVRDHTSARPESHPPTQIGE